jgi:hypothetical protein
MAGGQMTNKVWMVACSAIFGLATTAMTQTTAPPAQSSPSNDKKITVTGCLAAAPASSTASAATGTAGTTGTTATTGTTGTTGTTADASPAFQLNNAVVTPGEASGTTAGATTTDPASAATGQTYRLIANPTALSPHVGKKVALTGTLEDQAPASTSTATAAGADAKMPALRVETGKIVAESCNKQ